MAQEAATASPIAAGGAPLRPKATNRPSSRQRAQIQVGRSGQAVP